MNLYDDMARFALRMMPAKTRVLPYIQQRTKYAATVPLYYASLNDFFEIVGRGQNLIHDAIYVNGAETYIEGQREMTRALASRLGLAEGDHVVDLGSGLGGTAVQVVEEYGCTVVGLNISTSQLVRSRRFVRERRMEGSIAMVEGDIMAPPFRGEIFDHAYAFAVLSHLPDKGVGVSAVTKHLRPGGRFGINDVWVLDPAARRMPNFVEYANWVGLPPENMRAPDEMHGVFERAGLELVEAVDVTEESSRSAHATYEWVEEVRPQLEKRYGRQFTDLARRLQEFHLGFLAEGTTCQMIWIGEKQ